MRPEVSAASLCDPLRSVEREERIEIVSFREVTVVLMDRSVVFGSGHNAHCVEMNAGIRTEETGGGGWRVPPDWLDSNTRASSLLRFQNERNSV